ncbi:MAG: tryptophan-rich sensory protein [Geitlerinemataceae cyanobacterium]
MKSFPLQVNRDFLRQLSTLVAIFAAFGINVQSNVAPISGASIGEISNTQFQNVLITPANYAFAIWGLIYLGLFGFGFYQMQTAQRTHPILRRSSDGLTIASLAQIVWVWLFQTRFFVASLGAMLVILLALIYSWRSLKRVDSPGRALPKLWVDFPISIYLGWISVATIVNVAIALTSIGWQGWGISPSVWTVILTIVATGLGAIVCWKQQDFAFTAVTIWALVAIAVRQSNVPSIARTAAIGAIDLLGLMAWTSYRRRAISKHNVRRTK